MSELVRRKNNDPYREGWRIFFGDVQVGSITKRAGVPDDVEQWEWQCGFVPGLEPSQQRHGSAASYEQARAEFGSAWRALLPQLGPENFEAYRRDRAFVEWKYRMWKEGRKLPTQVTTGRSECFCGAAIDLTNTEQHVYQAHMEGS